jgi:hypothetical protein
LKTLGPLNTGGAGVMLASLRCFLSNALTRFAACIF